MNIQMQEITFDINDSKTYETIYSKQYDEGRQVVFHITKDGQPFDTTGYKVTFQMKKPDKTVVINDYDISNGTFTVTLTNQMTICAGNRIPFQIQLIKVTDDLTKAPIVLTTVTGYLKVAESVIQPDDVVNSDEFNALTHALIEVEELQISVTKAEELRQSNEETRQSQEAARSTNERNRQSQETDRQTNEFSRISGENTRCQNEETRQSNENLRNSNETVRQTNTADAIAKSLTATNNCVNAATDLQAKLDAHHFVLTSDKGISGGVAELDENGLVPSSQLPGYVDDVVEGYLADGMFYVDAGHSNELSGETGKIYVDLETNKTYRWSGSAFIVISETLALGETSSTAYRGDRGKASYDHSQAEHARTDATKVEASENNGNIRINDTETSVYIHPDSGATAGSYGDASDQSPAAGESFKVPYVTVNAMGHVTKASEHTVTLPSTSITVDDTLSEESTNPVENRVVTQAINELVNIIYPVGSIYMSVNSTNPGNLFGGTWTAWGAGRVPVGIDTSDNDFMTVEKTGGAKTHTLTVAQMPKHTHTFTGSVSKTNSQSATSTSGESTQHLHSTYYYTANATQTQNKNAFNMTIWTNHYSTAGDNMEVESNLHTHTYEHTHNVTAAGTNSQTGSGSAHNNLQPYVTCYMWKRTA